MFLSWSLALLLIHQSALTELKQGNISIRWKLILLGCVCTQISNTYRHPHTSSSTCFCSSVVKDHNNTKQQGSHTHTKSPALLLWYINALWCSECTVVSISVGQCLVFTAQLNGPGAWIPLFIDTLGGDYKQRKNRNDNPHSFLCIIKLLYTSLFTTWTRLFIDIIGRGLKQKKRFCEIILRILSFLIVHVVY